MRVLGMFRLCNHESDVNSSLGVTISEERGSEEAVRTRVSAAWGKWKDLSGVINDKKMPRKLKIELYMTVIRPGAEVIKPYSILRAQIPCSSLVFTPCSYST